MKSIFLFIITISFISYCQTPFKESGLYGLKNDDGEVHIQAEYKEILEIKGGEEYLFKGRKDKSWFFITNITKLKNSAYDIIDVIPLTAGHLYCVKGQKMDIFSIADLDYIVTDLKADYIEPNYMLEENLMSIYLGKKQGLFDLSKREVILKPEFDQIFFNEFSDNDELKYITVNEKMYSIISSNGEVVFDGIPYEITGASYYDSTEVGVSIYSSKFQEGYISILEEYIVRPKYESLSTSHKILEFVAVSGKEEKALPGMERRV